MKKAEGIPNKKVRLSQGDITQFLKANCMTVML
jgi:hypothetical protein